MHNGSMIEKRETALAAGLKWFFIIFFCGFVAAFSFAELESYVPSLALFWLAVAVVMVVVWRAWSIGRRIHARPEEFRTLAIEHKYGTGSKVPLRTQIFSLPEQRDARFINALHGEGWRYGDFRYNIYRRAKSSDYKAVEVYYSILELDLPRRLPNMFFDSPGSHGLQFLPHLDESQRTSLEGDFDKYFTTFFPMHYHIDARSIISPEVMAAMIDSGVSDIEIAGDKLYLYSPLVPVAQIPKFIKEGQEICKKLSDHVVFYRDEKLEDEMDRKGVSIFGQKLRKRPRFPWFTIVICGVTLVGVYILSQEKGDYRMLVFLTAVYAFSIIVEVRKSWWKVRRSNKSFYKRSKARLAAKKS